jgi:hypothetical protein
VTTVWRYVAELVDLLAAAGPDLAAAVQTATRKAYVILDGTLISIDRVGMRAKADRPYYSGKHKRHGLNVQVLADPAGRLIWASAALPGSVHDLKAARRHGLIHALTGYDIPVLADRGYQGARGTIRVPLRGRDLPAGPTAVNTTHARRRAPVRTRTRHPQDLAPPAPAALLPTTRHRARRRHPHPRNRHSTLRLEKAHCPSAGSSRAQSGPPLVGVVHDDLLSGQPPGSVARVRVQARWRSFCCCMSSSMAVGRVVSKSISLAQVGVTTTRTMPS